MTDTSASKLLFLKRTFGPILLMLLGPPVTMLLWHVNSKLGGSFAALFAAFSEDGAFATLWNAWGPYALGSRTAWAIVGIFAGIELVFMRFLPGRACEGPETISGHVPVYKANGRLAYAATLILFFLGGFTFKWFSPGIVYEHFGAILGALNITAPFFCLVLYLKGRFAPSGPDSGLSGNPIFDYYWGTELYPRIFGWDVKDFVNCRFGMMGWAVIILSFASWQWEHYGTLSSSMFVSIVLQLIYLSECFWWETGYFRTMDMQHDRAGFYLMWGSMVWVPAVYTSPAMYLVEHPVPLSIFGTIALLIVGTFFITAKNLSNRQRLRVRRTDGNTTVWGKPPVMVRAKYINEQGEEKENILLASGFWGIARHFHYVGEIFGAFCWSAVGGFVHFAPFFYVTYLSMLLFDRARRDDKRCQDKYGKYWDEYKAKVPWKIVPGVF
jgi:7-dehydrocholesterol reductase